MDIEFPTLSDNENLLGKFASIPDKTDIEIKIFELATASQKIALKRKTIYAKRNFRKLLRDLAYLFRIRQMFISGQRAMQTYINAMLREENEKTLSRLRIIMGFQLDFLNDYIYRANKRDLDDITACTIKNCKICLHIKLSMTPHFPPACI